MSENGEGIPFSSAVARIQQLIGELEEAPDPDVRRNAFELLDLIDVLHREALERLATGLVSSGLWDRAMEDPVVAHLFSVYGLVEEADPQAAVEAALEEVRDYVRSHGGELELASIDGGQVRLRMLGACNGCPGSEATLRQVVEEAIRRRWPGLVGVAVDQSGGGGWEPVTIVKRQ